MSDHSGSSASTVSVTRHKQVEEALRESEERLRLAQQAARIGTFDWNIQTGVNVWTPELEAMYGLPPGGFAKTQPAGESLVHPDDRAEALRKVELALQTGQSQEGEWRVIWPDGSMHWILGRFQMLKDESGKPLRLIGVNLDITERKRHKVVQQERDQLANENQIMMGREVRILDLKREVNDLLKEAGKPPRYSTT